MLGAGIRGAWQVLGRTSVIPAGQGSPGCTVTPPVRCAAAGECTAISVASTPGSAIRRMVVSRTDGDVAVVLDAFRCWRRR
jgi:hypothetical protein